MGILRRPLGEDANGDVAEAEVGTLVDNDSLGAGLPVDEDMPSADETVGDEPGFRRDEICCNEGSRAILGL